ncbi:kinase-like domain-containing protein [Aspergillus welwitschiae]|uniref:non-specific serine/threonine protein kinase n=1 Tax=Aspergillus welwitschiae TaxID=1341132 RepID=A0A3F3QB30_9EURO|nr:kinase-like domain-containing protein [Aspergillus welwitschiae]RDH36287.1 kinase-like domain-containing protein [Aspergillus welwitschiae]
MAMGRLSPASTPFMRPLVLRSHVVSPIPKARVERIEHYLPGGYHPIQIGGHLHGRYQVIHKLGHGSYSKIYTADSDSKEASILITLTHPHYPATSHPGKTMLPSIRDTFSIHGPNGEHTCYVTSPARASLSDLKDGSWLRLFQLDVARALAAQLVLAVDYIHTREFIHGDIHMGNILLTTSRDIDQLSPEQLYKKYEAPELDPVVHLDGKPLPPGVPSHGIAPIWLGEPSEKVTLPEASILLADFDEAFSSKETRYISHTPLVNRPPEARFEPNKPLPLFEGFLATEDYMTREHVDTLGILPPEWWKRWEARPESFTEDGRPIKRNPYRSWGDRFEDSVQQPRQEVGMPLFDAEERDAILEITTKQILESEWMVKWALPEYEKVRRGG